MAQRKVETQEITNALLEWRGNVEAAAAALGIRRNSLYERIRRLGLNLEGFRSMDSGPTTHASPVSGVSGRDRVSGVSGRKGVTGSARISDAAPLTDRGQGRRFGLVEAASEEALETPIKAAPGRIRPPRLRPNQQDRLREAKLDFGARYRVETDESLILQQFFDERFEEWFAAKLAPEAEGKKGRK